jgi:hypothetical protein
VAAERDFNTAAFTKELVKFADTEVGTAAGIAAMEAASSSDALQESTAGMDGRQTSVAAAGVQECALP